ncbi:uncharacterized protein [Hetaerina americana]|uniref:uncharacterized protein isoform X2 n=1 Tax=Hetaerina americana TaxID=62018 RepID=UPI003A7F38E8
MACDFYVSFKVLELILAVICITFKQVTDDEGTRLQIILRKLSEEWPLLNSITWDEHGSSLADVTYGGYVIICAGLLAGQIAGELKYPVMECFFLGLGVILYSALGGLELASLELLRPELVDNAAILGCLSLLMALIFIFDLIAGTKRRKQQNQKVDHYWKGVTISKSISTSTRGTQIDPDLDDEDEILSIASLPLPPPPGGVKTDTPSTIKRRVLKVLHLFKYGSPHTQESTEEPIKWATISSLGGGLGNGKENDYWNSIYDIKINSPHKPPTNSLFSRSKLHKDTLKSRSTFPGICAADSPPVAVSNSVSPSLPAPLPITFLLPVYSIATGSRGRGQNTPGRAHITQ